MSDEATEFLSGGVKIPAVKFPEPGAKVVGTVIKNVLRQQTSYDPKGGGKPLFWDNGDPIMKAVVTLQLDEGFEPLDEDDDGRRNLHVDKKKMRDAIRDAIRESGHKGQLEGGRLGVMFTKWGVSDTAPNPPKEWKAQYEPVAEQAVSDAPFTDDEPTDDAEVF